MQHHPAGMVIVFAALMNMIAKEIIVSFTCLHELRQMVVWPFCVVVLAGAVGMMVVALIR